MKAKNSNLTENALEVLKARYLHRKKSGIETPDEMFTRVAKAIANPFKASERKKRQAQFFQMMASLEFLPNSPTLMNAGKKNGQLAACFVLPIEDDLEKIMDALKWTALIHQSGGGTGFSFSKLRPTNAQVNSSHGVAAGPLGFLHLYNELTQVIKQGGLRRGANMGVLDCSHPDIEEFIKIKSDTSRITNFNLSVAISDRFMKAVEGGAQWDLIHPTTKKVVRSISAQKLFDLIADCAWKTGEPGLIFIDEVNRYNPTPKKGKIEATNPCGEQPLLPFEACNLGSINLNSIVSDSQTFLHMAGPLDEQSKNWRQQINWQKLESLTETSTLFLDATIDACHYPIPQITELCQSNRKIGLGVMGFADLLLKLKIRYGSKESLDVAHEVMERIRQVALHTSQALAKKNGAFEGFNQSLWKKHGVKPLRNATLTTVAPTGTISLIANASAGVEPVFSYAYQRNVLDGAKLWEVHPVFEGTMKAQGISATDYQTLIEYVSTRGTLKGTKTSEELLKYFVTARDVTTEQHVEMQAVFQKHSDSAVSKTINLPFGADVSEVKKAYTLAHQLKCKGITVYRDRSRPDQVLALKDCEDCSRIEAV